MQIVYIFNNVNLPQRVIYNCWIISFTNKIFQGFWRVRVRLRPLPLLIISLYKHGWEIPFFYPISARRILFISQDLYSGNTNLSQHIEFISKDMATQGYIWLTSDLLKLFSNNKYSFGTWVHHLLLLVLHSRTDLTLIAPNGAMRLLSTVHVHTTKHCRFYRGQQLGPVPHKTGHAAISTFVAYIKVCVETFSLHTSTSGIKSQYLFVLCRAKRNAHQSNTYRAVITQ
jgi:hypothetical protein